MKMKPLLCLSLALTLSFSTWTVMAAQTAATPASSSVAVVPNLINYSGVLTDLNGKPLSGVQGVTFLLYSSQDSVSPLWMETQNVTAAKNGQYSVTLGSTTSTGVPTDLFANGEARWLGVQVVGQSEQPRVLLVSVPYSMKAGDAQTLGGLPASAFMLATAASSGKTATASSTTAAASKAASSVKSNTTSDVTTTGGTVNAIPLFSTTTNIQNSVLTQSSKTINVGGKLNSPATGTATASAGKDSQPYDFVASAFNSSTATAVPQTFQLQAEPASNDTATASGTLNLLYASGTSTPAETGLKISSQGLLTFATGQTFPGTGDGTITGITTASGSGLSGGGTSGTLTLKIPAAGVTNAMLANSKVTLNANSAGGLTTPGAMSLGSTYTIGLKPCSASQVLEYVSSVWTCTTPAAGTVTSVASGAGLTGGPITGSGTLSIATGGVLNTMLANDAVTVTPGTGLSGGGKIFLGGSATLNINTAQVPLLGSNNAFSGEETINGPSSSVPLTVDSSGGLGDPQAELVQNNTSDFARLRLTDSGSTNYWDVAGTVSTSGSGPVLNFWNGGVGLNVLQIFPSYVQANAEFYANNTAGLGDGDGVDSFATEYGVYTSSSGSDGVVSYGGYDGGYFNGPSGGTYSENDTDSDGATAAYGFEFGSSQENYGVYGYAESGAGIGVYGQDVEASASGSSQGFELGIWGDSGESSAIAVLGSADDGWALYGLNNSDTNATLYVSNAGTGGTGAVIQAVGKGGMCTADVNGSFSCTGGVAAVASVNGGAKVALSAIHSAENWFEDAGSGQLSSGQAVVNIESVFGETVNTGVEYHVFLTPNGDCKGLYVAQKSPTSFVVKELGGGTSSIAFDYRIMAKRSGFETVRLADKTQLMTPNTRVTKGIAKTIPSARDIQKKAQEHAKRRTAPAVVSPTPVAVSAGKKK
jgi:hypothetical protein